MSFASTEIKNTDPEYPDQLREIAAAPEKLFCVGDTSLLKTFCLAVVGTRRATTYGKEITSRLARELASAGATVVSGLAHGIDEAAHRAALEIGGKTIAVLGTGLDEKSIYPPENINLAKEIVAKKGLIISEFPEGTPALPHHFPKRNRIVSGLSRGVIVVEAPEKSGALITAGLALEQNREVFAVPGPVNYANAAGPNRLIQQGAKLITTSEDILSEFTEFVFATAEAKTAPGKLSETELQVFEILKAEPQNIEELKKLSGLEIETLASTLSLLEIKRLVKNRGGAYYLV